MVWISSQSKSKDRINKEARGTELDQEECKPHAKVLGPNKRDEILQGLRQPKQSHSFSMTPEEQGIHKTGGERPCLFAEVLVQYDTTAQSSTSSSSATAWMVTTSTLLHALESPREHGAPLRRRGSGGGLPARGQAPAAAPERCAVLWPLPWAVAPGISLCLS